MDHQAKLNKVKSVIESCKTYPQVQSCFSFLTNQSLFESDHEKFVVLGWIQSKAYELRAEDIREHLAAIREIKQSFCR